MDGRTSGSGDADDGNGAREDIGERDGIAFYGEGDDKAVLVPESPNVLLSALSAALDTTTGSEPLMLPIYRLSFDSFLPSGLKANSRTRKLSPEQPDPPPFTALVPNFFFDSGSISWSTPWNLRLDILEESEDENEEVESNQSSCSGVETSSFSSGPSISLSAKGESPFLVRFPAIMEDQTNGDDDLWISEIGNGSLPESERVLRAETTKNLQTPYLGLMGDERSHSKKATATSTNPAEDGTPESVEEEATSMNEKGESLGPKSSSLQPSPKLGFEGASSSINGGRRFEPFKLDEFLRLANAVIDKSDEQTLTALKDLKRRWTERFQSMPSLHSLVEKRGPPPRVGGLRPALRCLLPSEKTNGASETAGNDGSRSTYANSDGNAPVVLTPATDTAVTMGDRRLTVPAIVGIQQTADVAILSDVECELADTMAVEEDGDVTGDVGINPDDIIADITADDISGDFTADDITVDAVMTASPVIDDVILHKKTKKQISNFPRVPTGLFVGNIPLNACSDTIIDDKIAHAFHNSTRKTLSYVAPTVQKGEIIVRPTLDIIRNGSKRWRATAVGYFLGKRPYFYHLKEFALSIWPDLKEVTGTNNGFFFLQFKSVAAMEEVIEGGPWLFQGQPIILQKWKPGMVLRKLQHTQVPVWIKLRHLSVELWTEEGLSTVASGVGKPLYSDAIMRACTRLDFARVCVMLDVTSNLPKHIIIMIQDEDGGESPCKVDVEYEWIPTKCKSCTTSAKECVLNKPKPANPPIAVYVPKVGTLQESTMPERSRNQPRKDGDTTYVPSRPTHMPDRNMNRPPSAPVVEKQREGRESPRDAAGPSREERAAPCLVIHVECSNMECTWPEQKRSSAFLLPQWQWFVDYGSSGNRIWIAWDENFIDVDVVECGTQFIHCHVNIRAIHESIAITVIYGANELVERRALWGSMETIAMQCTNIPWLVGGDFNAVRDLSEICGVSGDIRMAMEDFNTCIQNTGLLPLPMQGEWYTWHNCSAGPRNLWKRLDGMLINDRWMDRFPTSYYSCLTPRTSDHSPMVWQHHIIGAPMYAVTKKLKALKPVFREQRRNKGDLSHNVQLAKGFLEMAQLLVSSNRRDELFLQLEHCCRLVLAKAAKLEQIAQRRSARRILQINDDHGATHTDPGAVINEFVMYYQNLLGGERRRNMIDLRFLRPWARHILSEDDVRSLVLPFTPTDVKLAVFDIAEDKAPGPDGYSSVFFKAAWPIVGQEVSSAVLDFFNTGRLLKQINTTPLALIPKVHSPMTVGDFRPISCCNVLYKIIVKLLVQRLSVILDKLISPCQAAFVPGRSIGDNIMLAQELFTGYNQARLPPRCALKVDIRKAYDTVEWDFLIAVMELFGFPYTFVNWIEACVTTPSFSVGLNGKPHGFFRGLGGFGRCDEARIFQLGFTDDLLLFYRADMDSIGVFKTGLDRFAEWSGFRLNVQKSHLIISRSAQGLREEMLGALKFQEGVLPMRYLRLPLLSSRLTVVDCSPLLLKIDKRIAGWEGMALSYAGRVQIIKSVLLSLSLYWASAFILPKIVINEIEKRLRTFLWKGTTNSGYAKVAWKDLCRPKDEGGLGFKDIFILNRALMTKKLCDIIRCDRTSVWVEWLYQGRLRDTSIWTIREHGGSWGWRKILRLRVFLRPMVDYQIGDGRKSYLWQDPWHYLGPPSVTFPRGPRLLGMELSTRLSTVINGGEWQCPPITDFECLEITHNLPTIHGGEDRIIWRFDQGQPTVQALYRLFDPPGTKVGWSSLLSGSLKIPRHLFILWLAILGKLATTDKP
ncbi:UNVERIFIED_CONTAM: hypothetical protein Sindi_2640300 [Sesamum indicum]